MYSTTFSSASWEAETAAHRFPGGRKKIAALLDELRRCEREHPRVLEVGCGNGSLCLPVAALGAEVLGVDVDAASIERARARAHFPNARFLQTDGTLHDVDGSFDLIICSEVLEHLHDPRPLVAEMRERLAPEGRIFVTVPNGWGLREIGGRFEGFLRRRLGIEGAISALREFLTRFGMPSEREKYLMHTSNPEQGHVQRFTPHSFRRLLEGEGLEVVSWRNSFVILSVFYCREGSSLVERLDCRAADALPAALVSGWFVTCRKARGLRSS